MSNTTIVHLVITIVVFDGNYKQFVYPASY